MKSILIKFSKEVLFNSPLRRFVFPRYAYNFSVPQLFSLCQMIEKTRHVEGGIAEIGCSDGSTTVFLNKYMDSTNIEKAYVTLDTFDGFPEEDIQFEVSARRKSAHLFTGFRTNKQKWFDATMRQNAISRVRSIRADVNKFDLTRLGPLAFVLLDVDLYRPIKKALPELYQAMTPGGVIVVDDCDASNVRWDGADQAYKEFVSSLGLQPEIIEGKLGILRCSPTVANKGPDRCTQSATVLNKERDGNAKGVHIHS